MRDETEPDVGEAVQVFWEAARNHARLNPAPAYFGRTPLETVPPPAWSFGGTQEQAGELAALVLDGRKTATASALWDYEADDEPLPQVGQMSIVLDGHQRPVALIVTTEVATVPFDQVDAEHAEAEGEGDRSLDHWRETHERFFREFRSHEKDFDPSMPVVLERFTVLYPKPARPTLVE